MPTDLARRIRELRTRRALSQADLCNVMHVSPSAIFSWESGSHIPQPKHIRALAEALQVPVDYFTTPDSNQAVS